MREQHHSFGSAVATKSYFGTAADAWLISPYPARTPDPKKVMVSRGVGVLGVALVCHERLFQKLRRAWLYRSVEVDEWKPWKDRLEKVPPHILTIFWTV